MLAGCAHHFSPDALHDPYGFFSGIWQGMIFPFSVIGCIFFDSVEIIGRPNIGFFYYVGFAIGLSSLGSSAASKSQ